MNLGQLVRKLQKDISRLTQLVLNIRASVSGGEANTASNIGAGGVGLYDSKVGVDLRFRNINAGSTKLSVALDNPNHEVDIDVVQAQIDHGSIAGLGDDDHAQYLLAAGTRALTGSWDAGCAAGRVIRSGYLMAGAAVAAMVERLQTEARIALKETTDPVASAGYGKLWVSSADKLVYFMDSLGNIYDLTALGSGGGGGSGAPVGAEEYFHLGTTQHWHGIVGDGTVVVALNLGITTVSAAAGVNDDVTTFVRFSGTSASPDGTRSTNYTQLRRSHNPKCYFRIKTGPDLDVQRLWIGVCNASISSNVDDPAGATHYAFFNFSTTRANPNWYCITKDGAAQNVQDSGVALAASTIYDLEITMIDGGNVEFYITPYGGAMTNITSNANLPGNSTNLGLFCFIWGTGATARIFDFSYAFAESD